MKWLSGFFGQTKKGQKPPARIFFYNSLTERKDLFVPLKPGEVSLYSCGPTVYGQIHIGNLRAYIFSDTIARTLMHAGLRVRRVMNITDVGHMVGDGDEGEDKMSAGAKREKTSPTEIADRYTRMFIEDIRDLNFDVDHMLFPRATEYVKEEIALAHTLEEKGFAYRTSDGLYFDTTRFPTYGRLGGLAGASRKEGARVAANKEKRHPNDFALWRKAKPGDLQQWDSPWGYGNPGWSIECSTMARSLLGIEIDIHTGGEDLAQIHHNNEIAQSEAAHGRQFVRYWMHNAFLTIQGEKISKSIGNVVHLGEIIAKKFHPLSLRYLFLQAHYRTPLSFSWDALQAADEALKRLWRLSTELKIETHGVSQPSEARERFLIAIREDLGTPQALGILWESLKSDDLTPEQKWGLLEDADALLGLSLKEPHQMSEEVAGTDIPQDIKEKLTLREDARKAKDFRTSDELRTEIEACGYHVEDRPEGTVLSRPVK